MLFSFQNTLYTFTFNLFTLSTYVFEYNPLLFSYFCLLTIDLYFLLSKQRTHEKFQHQLRKAANYYCSLQTSMSH